MTGPALGREVRRPGKGRAAPALLARCGGAGRRGRFQDDRIKISRFRFVEWLKDEIGPDGHPSRPEDRKGDLRLKRTYAAAGRVEFR